MFVAIIPLLIASFGSINKAENELKTSLNEKYYLITEQITTQIDQIYINNWISDLQFLTNSLDYQEGLDESAINTILNSFLNQNEALVLISINQENFTSPKHFLKTDKLNQFVQNDSTIIEKLITFENKNPEETGKTFINSTISSQNNSDLFLPIEMTFEFDFGAIAVIRAIFELKPILEFLNKDITTGKTELYVIDESGNVIFTNPLGKFQKGEGFRYPISEKIKENLKGKSRTFTLESFDFEDKKYLSYVSRTSFTNWAIVVVDEFGTAYALVNQMRNDIALWVLVAIILCLFFSVIFSRSFAGSMKYLTNVAHEIGQGNFGIKVKIPSKDEIGQLAKALEEMAKDLRERELMKHFMSESTVQMITKSGDKIENNVERKEITVFFSDIRGFTAFSEISEPEQVISMLNNFISLQSERVAEFGGEIDKFVGDEIFALFMGKDSEKRAIKCALEIQSDLEKARQKIGEKIHVGIGIHSGIAVMGTVGYGQRKDHTVLGNTVNLGARLCSAAKPDSIIISETVYEKVSQFFDANEIEKINAKGISQPVKVYEILKEITEV